MFAPPDRPVWRRFPRLGVRATLTAAFGAVFAEVFAPSPDGLLVNLSESRDLVQDLLTQLPDWFSSSQSTRCCLGAALQAAYKLVVSRGVVFYEEGTAGGVYTGE